MTKISLRSWSSSSEPSLGDPETLSQLREKLFKVTHVKDGATMISELIVARANSTAVLFRTKKGAMSLVDSEDLITMEEIEPPVIIPKLTVRQLGEIANEQVRQHLADRHGMVLTEIPDDMVKAAGLHVLLHSTPNLGHRHGKQVHQPVPPAEVARRTAELDAAYEKALECDECGYMRLPEEDGRMFHRFVDPRGMASEDDKPEYNLHCDECKDDDQFNYNV